MHRLLTLIATLLIATWALTAPASAESDTVQGSGVIDKMFANNKDTKVLVKIFAPGGAVHSVEARMKGTDGQIYRAVVLNGPDGDKALYKGQGNDVSCSGLSIGYNSDGGFWRFVVPRGCLDDLTNKIKVKGYYAAVWAPGPTVTPWTEWLRRG